SRSKGSSSRHYQLSDPAVSLFREYLRLRTVHPEPDYGAALRFLDRMALELKLPAKKVECGVMRTDTALRASFPLPHLLVLPQVCPGRVVLIMTWLGSKPSLKSIVLNSHVDVVPVYQEHWKYDAFAAVKDDEGNIYGRGAQDMKCVTIQYIEAVRRLRARGTTLPRTVHFLFVPDEEVGGHAGMEMFVKHPEFTKLNIGFALDEGDRRPAPLSSGAALRRRICSARSSRGLMACHGLQRRVINAFLDFRESERKRLNTGECFTLGDVTTVNMTKVNGGVAYNVVPAHMDVSFDMRIPPTVDLQDFEERIKRWCREAGEDVTYQFAQKHMDQEVTSTADSNPWWSAFSTACRTMNMNLKTEIFPAATDSRFFRAVGLPAIGFSPMNNTPILLHDHNEFLNERVFLRGIDVYECLVPALASVAPGPGEA
uniref:N-acyl-aliphatic-L-amino acid amidohydrolase n=1 Tax=Scleropages formosus TaxID=113540 RepID=A0A8C9U1B0_SCLFO